jgi:mannose-6-phosphate isomerase-like protein (cupin superfamily)
MFKATVTLLASCLALSTSTGTGPMSAIYVSNADIQSTLSRSSQGSGSDQPIRVVDLGGLGYDLGVGVVSRPKASTPSAPVEHDNVTEIYHVIKGSGELVTGGVLVDAKPRSSDSASVLNVNGPSRTGTSIRGGHVRRISDGDVVIIPAGVPHWFSEIHESLTYLVVRIDPGKVIALK